MSTVSGVDDRCLWWFVGTSKGRRLNSLEGEAAGAGAWKVCVGGGG